MRGRMQAKQQQPRATSKSRRHRRHDRQLTRTGYSVQDRRQNARVLQASEERRAQLCPLTTLDVARGLHALRAEPTTVLDDASSSTSPPLGGTAACQPRRSSLQASVHTRCDLTHRHTNNTAARGKGDGEGCGTTPPLPRDYEAWLSAGCPTAAWDMLLAEDLYGREEADRAFLALKYSLRGTQAAVGQVSDATPRGHRADREERGVAGHRGRGQYGKIGTALR